MRMLTTAMGTQAVRIRRRTDSLIYTGRQHNGGLSQRSARVTVLPWRSRANRSSHCDLSSEFKFQDEVTSPGRAT
jgi:hypothetical protein